MPRINDMIESKFLKQADVGSGVLATVCKIAQYNVAMQGAEPDMKWCLEFKELDKPLVLNSTNMHILEAITGSDNSDDWMGKQIVLYTDPNISFGGKIVGGIRVRAPKKVTGPKARPTSPPPEPDEPPVSDEQIPF